jgi:hypothetical protein
MIVIYIHDVIILEGLGIGSFRISVFRRLEYSTERGISIGYDRWRLV